MVHIYNLYDKNYEIDVKILSLAVADLGFLSLAYTQQLVSAPYIH